MEDTQQMRFIEVDGTLVFLMKQKLFVIWTLRNRKLWKQHRNVRKNKRQKSAGYV